jgi:peptidoglycan hydrolase-like protein with peptidoglycan-binding domain
MSYASRVYRQRNPRSDEKSGKEGFFSKQDDTQKDSRPGSFFQTKLAVNKPGDKYEQEADSVANSVVNQSSKNPVVQQKDISAVQRAAAPEEKKKPDVPNMPEKKEEDVQRKAQPEMKDEEKKKPEKVQKKDEPKKEEEDKTGTVQAKRDSTQEDASGLSRLENPSDKGTKLSPSVLKEMNTSFGADFNDVRIHDNKESAKMNNAIQAQAFTHGKDIYFNDGKYSPQSSSGKKLLAHELTHTIQQGGKSSRSNTPASSVQQKGKVDRNLQSSRFAGEPRLEEALDDIRKVKYGDEGEHVKKLQQAMLDLNIDLHISTRKTGSPDGIFKWETEQAVMTFQRKCGLVGNDVDGIVGPITMGLFDARFSGESNPPVSGNKKRVTVNITYLYGNKISSSRALAYANTIYIPQANIEIVKGKEVTLGLKETEALIGKDLMLEMHFFDHSPSNEERVLFNVNQSSDAITAYFVKEIAEMDGSISKEAVAYSLSAANKMGLLGVALGSRSKYQTLAHELGHVLGVAEHTTGEEFLMTAEAPGYRLSPDVIKTMRSSSFAKDV